ncbi:MAG: hypothetical protein CMJ31_07845 [Phycisphaerae bacterium]|nr:hypothetical protein [Phycisphaerae bacterium]
MPNIGSGGRSARVSSIAPLLVALLAAAASSQPGREKAAPTPLALKPIDGAIDLAQARWDAEWNAEPRVRPEKGEPFTIDLDRTHGALDGAPLERQAIGGRAGALTKTISLPTPEGDEMAFRVVEAPVMAPELAAKFPEIRTYVAYAVDDERVTARLSVTPKGLHAQVRGPSGTWYVDPFSMTAPDPQARLHTAYRREDLAVVSPWVCGVTREAPDAGDLAALDPAPLDRNMLTSGEELHTFRLAVSTTGEYAQYHGGTVADAMAEIVIAINRVTGVYETEVGVRLELIANNDLLIFLDGSSDPYDNGNATALLSQNPSVINGIVGSSAYDIGHNFSTGGGGLAAIGVVCTSSKARGITGLSNPVGDPFYVDYVCHEMGHQFDADHTFNGVRSNCSGFNRVGSSAYEPGSGNSIMAYAGICGSDNIQSNTDAFFHSRSYDQIRAFVEGFIGSSCAVVTPTGNTPPIANAGPNHAIPTGTPFELTATGSDPDGQDVTFAWEQRDLGPAQSLESPDNGSSPLFVARPPTTSPSRTFPQINDLLAGVMNVREELPSLARSMDFRVTVRDGVGGVDADDLTLDVVETSEPFAVTAPAEGSTHLGGATVQWTVAETNLPPINAATVDILLSTDGGQTFSTVLASGVPNDGSADVTLPNVSTSSARIRVQPTDNVFFNVSPGNFTIEAAPLVIVLDDAPPPSADPFTLTPITVRIDDAGEAIDPSTARLFTSVDGEGFVSTPLAPLGENRWTATLPGLGCGSDLQYYFSATSLAGTTVTLPEGAPLATFELVPGGLETLFFDTFDALDGWSVSGDATAGHWQRGTPLGTGARGDPTSGFDDGFCYATGLPEGDSDVDGGSTILTSPLIPLTGASTLRYAYWFSDLAQIPADDGDGLRVEVSSNGGADWVQLIEHETPLEAWREVEVQIPSFLANPNFRIRFVASDVRLGSIIEAAVDAVRVEGFACEAAAVCGADIAAPLGKVDIADVVVFLNRFGAGDQSVDFAAPYGTLAIEDVIAYLQLFGACPR